MRIHHSPTLKRETLPQRTASFAGVTARSMQKAFEKQDYAGTLEYMQLAVDRDSSGVIARLNGAFKADVRWQTMHAIH